jgi:hypothetical protein
MRQLVADFECTTDINDCRVWVFGICDINAPDYFYYGSSIDEFMSYAKDSNNSTFYFHNLEYDGEFILSWLFTHGFEHVTDRRYLDSNKFTTVISDMGKFYTMKIMFEKKNKKANVITIYDSNKIIPLSVKKIPKAFGLPMKKGDIDYNADNGNYNPPTDEELDYLQHDVNIVAYALQWFVAQGYDRMTIGSNALEDYKQMITKKNFNLWFPPPDYETDKIIRYAYRGGFTWLEPKYKGKDLEVPIIVLDVNSLYPDRMHNCKLPFDDGIRFEGKYQEDKMYCLYVQCLSCDFKLKPNYIPTLQIKKSIYNDSEYLTSSNDEHPTIYLTNLDLELLFEHYDVCNIQYQGGYKWRGSFKLFDMYVDKWMEVKEKATKEDNKGIRTISKLFQNNIYGKLSTNPLIQGKVPYLDDDGIVKYKLGEEEIRDGVHIGCGAFITAYARHKTITAAQTIRTAYAKGESDIDIVYCDTDSLHCISPRGVLPEGLEIHDSHLGAWKHENKNGTVRARFLRQKSYLECEIVTDKEYEKMDDEEKAMVYYWNGYRIINHVTCAGLPENCHSQVTWDNFHIGATYKGKLTPKHVKGGIVLVPSTFKIKNTKY